MNTTDKAAGDMALTSARFPFPVNDALRPRYNEILAELRGGGMPSFEEVRGRVSPYTNSPIQTPDQYDEYLRQFAFSVTYYEVLTAERKTSAELRSLLHDTQDRLHSAQDLLHDTQDRLEHVQKEKARSLRRLRLLRAVFAVITIAFIFVAASVPGWRTQSYYDGYESASFDLAGYAEEQYSVGYDDGYNDGHDDGYDSGYTSGEKAHENDYNSGRSAGYVAGYAAGSASVSRSSYSLSGGSSSSSRRSSSSGFDFPDPEPDAGYYIGNRSTKKFHKPSCSYLPAEENRVIFYERSDAVNAGYSSCGKCNP